MLMHRVRPGWRRQWALSVCQHRLTFFFFFLFAPRGVDLLHLDRLLAFIFFIFYFFSSPALLSLTLTRSDWARGADARCKNPRLRQIFDEVIFARLEDGSRCWHLCTFCTVCLSECVFPPPPVFSLRLALSSLAILIQAYPRTQRRRLSLCIDVRRKRSGLSQSSV